MYSTRHRSEQDTRKKTTGRRSLLKGLSGERFIHEQLNIEHICLGSRMFNFKHSALNYNYMRVLQRDVDYVR